MRELGIDLGTANTVVCHPQDGILLDEPSVMLVRDGVRRHEVVATGRDAVELLGRAPLGLTASRPVRDGVITDLEVARAYLRVLLRRLAPQPWQRRGLRAVIGVPVGSTALERRALLEAADEAGIGKATALADPIAGAVGCGLDPMEKRMQMVIDIGGGTAEATAFCFGGVVTYRSTRTAGNAMTVAVYRYLREQYQLIVGELAAEQIKYRTATEDGASLLVEGRDAATGRPRLATVPVAEITESLRPVTEAIVQDLVTCLDDMPAQGVGDVMAAGILVFGGASLLRGFDQLLEKAFGFPVKRAEQPLTCVAEGAARCLRNPALLEAYRG
ncbi:MAG TPA: rod shape-determining protein [Pseudonocardiaceae bacterium]